MYPCRPGFPSPSPAVLLEAPSPLSWRAPTAVCSFYAPSAGTNETTRLQFWSALDASLHSIRALLPHADLVLCGDANLHLPELGSAERPADRVVRPLFRDLCTRHGLSVCNAPGVATHICNHVLDLVLSSRPSMISDLVVHNGLHCCLHQPACCPALCSDHYLLTFSLTKTVSPVPVPVALAWPRVDDWSPVLFSMRPWLLQWSSAVRDLLHRSVLPCNRQSLLNVLYGSLVVKLWSCVPQAPRRRSRRRPVWWNSSCRSALLQRNSLYRQWRASPSASLRCSYRAACASFRRTARLAQRQYWEESVARVNSAAGSFSPAPPTRVLREVFGIGPTPLPVDMNEASPCSAPLQG